MTDEAARDFGREQHRIASGLDRLRPEPRHRAASRFRTDARGICEIVDRSARAVVVVALHAVAVVGDDSATDAVARCDVAAEKAVAVSIHATDALRAHRSAVGILDAAVVAARGRLRGLRHRLCVGHRSGPRMVEIQVGKDPRHERSVGEPVIRIFFGESRDVACRLNGCRDRRGRRVRRARRSFALAEVDRDAEAAVAIELHRFEFAKAHADRKAGIFACRHFGGIRAVLARALENVGYQRLQIVFVIGRGNQVHHIVHSNLSGVIPCRR